MHKQLPLSSANVPPDFVGCRYHQYACKTVLNWINKAETARWNMAKEERDEYKRKVEAKMLIA